MPLLQRAGDRVDWVKLFLVAIGIVAFIGALVYIYNATAGAVTQFIGYLYGEAFGIGTLAPLALLKVLPWSTIFGIVAAAVVVGLLIKFWGMM